MFASAAAQRINTKVDPRWDWIKLTVDACPSVIIFEKSTGYCNALCAEKLIWGYFPLLRTNILFLFVFLGLFFSKNQPTFDPHGFLVLRAGSFNLLAHIGRTLCVIFSRTRTWPLLLCCLAAKLLYVLEAFCNGNSSLLTRRRAELDTRDMGPWSWKFTLFSFKPFSYKSLCWIHVIFYFPLEENSTDSPGIRQILDG